MNTTYLLITILAILGVLLLLWGMRAGGPGAAPEIERRGPDAVPNVEIGEILLLSGMKASGKTRLAERIGAKYNGCLSVLGTAKDESVNAALMRYGNPQVLIFEEATLTADLMSRAKHWAASGMKRVIICTHDTAIAERLVRNPSNRRIKHIHLDRDGVPRVQDEPTAKLQARATTIVSGRRTFGPNDETPSELPKVGGFAKPLVPPSSVAHVVECGAGKHLPESGD